MEMAHMAEQYYENNVEVWMKNILCRFIVDRTHFGMARGG